MLTAWPAKFPVVPMMLNGTLITIAVSLVATPFDERRFAGTSRQLRNTSIALCQETEVLTDYNPAVTQPQRPWRNPGACHAL